MHRSILPLLIALAVLGTAAPSPAQIYDCVTAGGIGCRELIPDVGAAYGLESTITVVPSGACTGSPVSQVAVEVDILHDWVSDVGITLTSPSAATDVLRWGQTGLSYPDDDLHQLYYAPSLVGSPAAGAWTLELTDRSYSGEGALDGWTLYLVCGTVPLVTITAPDPTALESPLSQGRFLVSRSVVTAEPLEVELVVSGTATSGADYTPIVTTVTIPANQASLSVPVIPVADGVPEGVETVQASVVAGPLFAVGSPAAATVRIQDQVAGIPSLDGVGLAALIGLLAAAGALLLRRRLA